VPRRPYRKVKPHQVVEAVELYRGGMTLRGVAKHLGVAPDTARPVLVEAEVATRVSDRPRGFIVHRVRLLWSSQLMASGSPSPAILMTGREVADIDRLVVVGDQMRTKTVYRPGGKPIVIKTRSGWAIALGLLAIAAAIMFAGASVLGIVAWNWLRGERVGSSGIVDAKVFQVTPKDINCRAVVGSVVTADASTIVKIAGREVPLVSAMLGTKSKFRNLTDSAKGGVVDTLVCAKAAGTRDEHRVESGTNHVTHVIHIPVSNIVFDSKVVENESTVIRDDGILNALGSDFWKLIPFFGDPIADRMQADRSRLDVAVRAFAINVGQENCAKEAWESKLVEQAITEAYRSIAEAEQRGFDPTSLTVVFDPAQDGATTPDFTGPYDLSKIPGEIKFSGLETDPTKKACTVRDDAYRQKAITYTEAEDTRNGG
jgi:hypothetical protein